MILIVVVHFVFVIYVFCECCQQCAIIFGQTHTHTLCTLYLQQ